MAEELSSIVEFSADISKAEAPEPLPVGIYQGVIRSALPKMSQRDTRYAEVWFVISADQYPADYTDGNPDGTTLAFRRCSLEDTPAGRYGTRMFCESIGAPCGKEVDTNLWLNLEAQLEVGHESYEGVNRSVIQRVRAA